MLQLLRGYSNLPGVIRFDSGQSRRTADGQRHTTTHFVINPLRRIYGIAWKAKWFFGFMSFEEQTYERPTTVEPAPQEDTRP